jgi:hypothetical protein
VSSIKLKVGKPEGGPSFYAVNLHFADPEVHQPGERVFDIYLQGEIAAKSLDLAKESPGRLNPLVKRLQHVKVTDSILIELKPVKGETVIAGIEIIEE